MFGKLERLAADRLKLSPLTILIPQQDESPSEAESTDGPRRRAIVIEDPKGTEIQFRGPIDFLGGQLPPVKGGQMIGEIQIYAPPKTGNPQDGLLVETKELRIDRRHIWTTSEVKMRLGRSRVEGRDLFHLSRSRSPFLECFEHRCQDSPFNGLDHLELIYVDRVHIDLPENGLFADRANGMHSVQPPRPAHARVRCDGAFISISTPRRPRCPTRWSWFIRWRDCRTIRSNAINSNFDFA